MKVTVIFGETRVVVPCGQGDFLVSELIEKAVVRYRKAAGKTTDHYVHIHTLKSYNDGGILDLDDVLLDVVDDREQIVAEYEEQSGPSVPQGGDGTSGSSVGSASPDAFQSNRKLIPPSIPMKSAALSQPAVQPHRSSPSVTNSVRSSPALYIDSAIDAKLEHQPHKLLPSFLTNSSRDRTVTQSDRQLSSFSSSVAALRPQPEKAPMLNNNVDTRHSVEVTEHDLASGTGLQVLSVRRDSEPNIVSALEAEEKLSPMQSWAHSHQEGDLSKSGRPVRSPSESSEGSSSPGFNRFARDSSRQSLTGQNVLKWASAQERQQDFYDQVPADDQQVLGVQTDLQHGRREPLGQSWSPGEDRTVDTRLVVLKNEDGPLGIHVVPHKDQLGRESGIAIQGIEPGGRVHRSGQIQINDVIVEINGNSLRQTNFSEAQEIFRDALQTDEIRLRVRRPAATRTSSTSSANDSSAPISPKPHSLFKSVPPPPPQRSPNTTLSNQSSLSSLPRHNQLSPTQSAGPVLETSSGSSAQSMMPSNSRKLGKKIHIELTKGPEGLGFSITTRDNPAGGLAPPIYVKNILPKGAAIADGRLKSGDRLLEVNNMDMTGKSQNEVVAILRNTKRGSTVTLCVSRLDTGDSSSSLPRQMAISGISVPCTPTTKRLLANALRYNSLLGMSWDGRDDTLSHRESPSGPKTTNNDAISSDKRVLALNIPLNETGSAGLGISVKGKTSTASDGHHKDLGIFIKAVIHGGAASKDGRLQINDQLLCVNDDDLKKKTNAEAMETLRKAMHTEGPMPGHIKLTVERKVSASVSSGSTPEPWESSTTDSTVTGRNSTDGGMEPLGNRVVEVTLAQHNERKLSTTVTAEATLSPVEPVDAQNVIEQMRNPVLDRITGGGNSKLSDTTMDENESYHIATHEDSDGEESYDPPSFTNQSTIPTPTQPHNTSNVMMIEEDNNKQTVLQQPRRIEESQLRARPLSTIGGIGIAAAAEAKQKRTSELESEKRSASPPPSSTASGEESNMNTFDREAFGRRSFSEKRKASNGKNKEVVAKVKALREEMKLETASAQASGSEQENAHSGPYKFKPLTLDLSVTSAYKPATPLSIQQLPNSPLYLHRTTSSKSPPGPSLSNDVPSFNRPRTLSTSSTNGGNGRRPVPAPRLSIGSRTDGEYQTIDSTMPDVQVSDNVPSSGSATAQSFLYPELGSQSPPSNKETGFSRASTLPISAQRPQFDSQFTRSQSRSPEESKRNHTNHHSPQNNESVSSASTPDNRSSRSNARKMASMKRINSRTSLTDVEKSERRKSDLLESSPYPQLYNLGLDDESCPSQARPSTNARSIADPIYSQINKISVARCAEAGDKQAKSNIAMSIAGQSNTNADESSNSAGDGSEMDSNTPSHAGGPSSPIYERIDVVSSIPSDHWHLSGGSQSNDVGASPESIVGTRKSDARLFRVGSAESLLGSQMHDRVALDRATDAQGEATGPSLGLKKNSSFESLQAMVEDTIKGSGEPSLYKPPNRVSRGRGCNESFRAAVDRSYVPTPPSDHMDSDDKQGHRQRPRGHSASVNVDSELHRKDEKVSEENEPDQMVRGPMSSSFSGGEIDSEKKKSKKSKNGGGILGLFRLTKARKSLEERGSKSSVKASKAEEKERSSSLSQAAKSGQPDSDRIQDYYKRLHEKQKAQVAESYSQQPEFGTYPRNERSRGNSSSNPPPVPPHANNYAKAEQLASIRAQHQRRHQDRQGQYPTDTTDDFYERKIKERELKRSHHGKSKSIDDTANLEFFAAVNNRAYGTGAEFNPRHKSSQPSGMSNSVPNRASFYADPRYHDYHRSTQSNYYPNDHNSNVSAQQPPLVPAHRSSVTSKIDAYNNSVAKPTPANNNSDYAKINKADRPGAHRRFPSYDSSAAPFHLTSNRHEHDVILDYDDPQGSENSLYARVRKQPSMGHAVSNPSRV
ncbi:partitioning defective protein 3-like isoform X4 [Watersipora subatra]|uniref:partitioning defective protein 3-like isoform X4 n=1 Tax=Watersipora subatra TaxID=2589382 RepID=UPI00355AFBE1